MREWCQEPQGVSACAHRTRVASYADEPVLKYKTSTYDPFAQSRRSRCSMIVVPKQKASDLVQHSAILGLCLLYMAERLANRISQFKEFFCCEVHGTAQLRDSCRSFGTFEARNPSLFQDLSSFTACLYMGAVALPTSLSLSLSGPMRQTSSRRSPKPIVDKRLVLRGGQLCKSLCLLLLICPCACPSPTAAAAHAREEHKECEQLCIDDEVIA